MKKKWEKKVRELKIVGLKKIFKIVIFNYFQFYGMEKSN